MFTRLKKSRIGKVFKKLLVSIQRAKHNLKGPKIDKHIIIFQSDDWGSIRVSSRENYDKVSRKYPGGANPFSMFDCLESLDDINGLVDVLRSFKDKEGNNPCFTLNFAMANPDFERISFSNKEYHNKPFYESYSDYYQQDLLPVINQAIKQKIFDPQLHCMEHLNVNRWFHDLLNGDEHLKFAYSLHMTSVEACYNEFNTHTYQDSFNYDDEKELPFLEHSLLEATNIFADSFSKIPRSFVASCYIWDDSIEELLCKRNIKYIQTGYYQYIAHHIGTFKMKKRAHYFWEKTNLGIRYLLRNCSFEPMYYDNKDECIKKCMLDIRSAFKRNKPAIIDSHRVNYIGGIFENNRINNLNALAKLISQILCDYPDAIFMSTEAFIDYMEESDFEHR